MPFSGKTLETQNFEKYCCQNSFTERKSFYKKTIKENFILKYRIYVTHKEIHLVISSRDTFETGRCLIHTYFKNQTR